MERYTTGPREESRTASAISNRSGLSRINRSVAPTKSNVRLTA